jgi:hypothetical protein
MLLTHAAFQADLEVCVLQQTSAVDAFLASCTAAWAPAPAVGPGISDGVAPLAAPLHQLRALYSWDLAQPTWHAFAAAHAAPRGPEIEAVPPHGGGGRADEAGSDPGPAGSGRMVGPVVGWWT